VRLRRGYVAVGRRRAEDSLPHERRDGRDPGAWQDFSAPTCGTGLMGAHFPGPTAGPRRLQAAMGTPRTREREPRGCGIAEDGVGASVPAIVCELECRGGGPPNAFAHQLRADAVLVSLPRARQLDALVRRTPVPPTPEGPSPAGTLRTRGHVRSMPRSRHQSLPMSRERCCPLLAR